MEELDNKRFEINALKSLLNESDYQIIKLVENFADCTNATALFKVIKEFVTSFGELVAKRRTWRARINELEEEIAEIEATLSTNGDNAPRE